MSLPRVGVLRLGLTGYIQGLGVQKELERRHLDHIAGNGDSQPKDVIIVTEHRPVYTVGIRTWPYPESERTRLQSLGAEFVKTNRGGLITFHGPGQLVVYPVLNLAHFEKKSVRWYVCRLEKAAILACRHFGVEARLDPPNTGVWVADRKICAIGVHVGRYVTTHGLALNCEVDLGWFKNIVPCGIEGKGVTSLSEQIGRNVPVEHAADPMLDALQHEFRCELYELESW